MSGFQFQYRGLILHIRMLMWLLSGSFATLPGIWHHIWSCHCPWPLISQVCISRDICRHLPASDWSSVCISCLWLADSVITASPSQSLRSIVSILVLTLGGSCRQCVVYSRAWGPIRGGGGGAASQYQPSRVQGTLQRAQYRSQINDNFLSGVQVFYTGHWHLASTNCQELN